MTPLLAELPALPNYTPWLIALCIVVFVCAAIGLGVTLSFFRRLRSDLASELKRDLDAESRPAPISVQQPLQVAEHQTPVTRTEHEKLAAKMEDEFRRERLSRKGLYEKVEDQGKAIASLKTSSEVQTKQLTALDAKMDQVLMRLPRKSD